MNRVLNSLLRRCTHVVHNFTTYRFGSLEIPIYANNLNLKFFICNQTRFSSDSASKDTELEEFGAIAEREGVSVFKLPIDKKLPPEYSAEEERPKPKFFSRYPPRWYFNRCKNLAKERKEMECLRFFEEKMLKEDQVFPEEENFTVVMGAMGRIGHAKKAFQLYSMMGDRAIRPSMAAYTALFNAVAQSSDSQHMEMAIGLYKKLHRRKIRLNRKTYNSLIKVFGRHGTTEQMMGIFRESMLSGFEPDSESFNMILLCLQKDKKAGFRHAIEVWRMMLMLGIKPDGKTVMYLLKVMKNCGIGDTDVAYRKLIKELPNPAEYQDFFQEHFRNVYWLKGQKSVPRKSKQTELPPKPEVMTITPGLIDEILSESETVHELSESETEDKFSASETEQEDKTLTSDKNDTSISFEPLSDIVLDGTMSMESSVSTKAVNLLQLPFEVNLMNKSVATMPVSIKKCEWPDQRLQLIGGHEHIFEILEKNDILPTVMLLTTLVQVLEPTNHAENEVIEFVEKHRVKVDVDFFNLIMRKRVSRRSYKSLTEVLKKIVSFGLSPNYRTWCITALSCVRGHSGVELLNEIKNTNVELNHIFFNSLISAAMHYPTSKINGYNGVKGYDYRYLTRIVHEMEACNVKADQYTIKLLEKATDWPKGYNKWEHADQDFEKKVFRFRYVYKKWLENVEVKTEKKLF